MGQFTSHCSCWCFTFLRLIKKPVPRRQSPSTGPSPSHAPLRRLLLALVLHAFHLIPVGVFLQVTLAAAARAEPEGQVVALLGPHVLAALLLIPRARAADAVELDEDGALPLVETLQMHPVAVRAELVVAEHPLVVVLLQVDGAAQAAAERGRTLDLWRQTGQGEEEALLLLQLSYTWPGCFLYGWSFRNMKQPLFYNLLISFYTRSWLPHTDGPGNDVQVLFSNRIRPGQVFQFLITEIC